MATITSPGTNGAVRTTELSLEPPRRRRVRLPELAVGVLVTAGFALAAVMWQLSSVQREPALALAVDVAQGEVIEADDLQVVYLSSDDAIAHIGRNDAEVVVGRTAAADLPSGSLLTTGQVAEPPAVKAGEGIVGLLLDAGQFPSLGLTIGDTVNVVSGAAPGPREARTGGVVATGAEVTAVDELAGQERRFVSIRLAESEANAVATAAEQGPVRLVLVGR